MGKFPIRSSGSRAAHAGRAVNAGSALGVPPAACGPRGDSARTGLAVGVRPLLAARVRDRLGEVAIMLLHIRQVPADGRLIDVQLLCDLLLRLTVNASKRPPQHPRERDTRTGACAEKRRVRYPSAPTAYRPKTRAPSPSPSPQPHAPQATRSAHYTQSSSEPEREAHGPAYPQHPAP